jgi:drug/metabolite transporter (DMT)-like permease
LASLLLVDSLFFISARLLGSRLDPFAASFYYMLVATIELVLYAGITRKLDLKLLRKNLAFFAAIGFCVALSIVLAYAAVQYIDPGTASMLSQFGMIVALALGLIWLRERLRVAQWIGAGLAFVGVFIVTFQPQLDLRLGALLVLLSNSVYVMHTALTKRFAEDMDFVNFFTLRVMVSTLFLCLFALGSGRLEAPDGTTLLLLLLFGTTDVVISRALYYAALRRLSLSLHTIVLTLSPVLTILWSWLLFADVPGKLQFAGGFLVLAGVAVATLRPNLPSPPGEILEQEGEIRLGPG